MSFPLCVQVILCSVEFNVINVNNIKCPVNRFLYALALKLNVQNASVNNLYTSKIAVTQPAKARFLGVLTGNFSKLLGRHINADDQLMIYGTANNFN